MPYVDNGTEQWLGTQEIASLLRCSVATVQRRLRDPVTADRFYGAGNWRDRDSPLAVKKVYRVRRSAVETLASGRPDAG